MINNPSFFICFFCCNINSHLLCSCLSQIRLYSLLEDTFKWNSSATSKGIMWNNTLQTAVTFFKCQSDRQFQRKSLLIARAGRNSRNVMSPVSDHAISLCQRLKQEPKVRKSHFSSAEVMKVVLPNSYLLDYAHFQGWENPVRNCLRIAYEIRTLIISSLQVIAIA